MANVNSGYNIPSSDRKNMEYPDQPPRNPQGFNYLRNNDTNRTIRMNNYWEVITSRKISILASFISIIMLLCLLSTVMFLALRADDSYPKIHFERLDDASTKPKGNSVEQNDILNEYPNSEYSYNWKVFETLPKSSRQRLKRSTDQAAINGCKKNREKCEQLMNKVLSMTNGVDSNVEKIEEVMASLSETGQNEVLTNLNYCFKCRKFEYERQIPNNDDSHEWSSQTVNRDVYQNLFPMLNNGQPERISIPIPGDNIVQLTTNWPEDFMPETSTETEVFKTEDGDKVVKTYKDIDDDQEIHIIKTNVSKTTNGKKITNIIKNTTIIEIATAGRIPVVEKFIQTDNGGFQNNGDYLNTCYQNISGYQNYLSSQNYQNVPGYQQGQSFQGGLAYSQGSVYPNLQNQIDPAHQQGRIYPGKAYQQGQNYPGPTYQPGQMYQNTQFHQTGQNCQTGSVYGNSPVQQSRQNYQNVPVTQQGQSYQGGQTYQQDPTGFDQPNVQIVQNGPIYPNPLAVVNPPIEPAITRQPGNKITQQGSQTQPQQKFGQGPAANLIKPAQINIQISPGNNTNVTFNKKIVAGPLKVNGWIDGDRNFQPSANPTAESSSTKQILHFVPSVAWFPFPVCFFMPQTNMQASGSFPAGAVPFGMPNQQSFGMQNQQFFGIPNQQSFGTQNMMNFPQTAFSTRNGPVPSQSGAQYSQAQQPTNTHQGAHFEKIGPTGPGKDFINPNNQMPSNSPHNPYYCAFMPAPSYPFSQRPNVPQMTFRNYETEATGSSFKVNNGLNSLYNSFHDDRSQNYCLSGKRICNSGILCISESKWCDGYIDCTDASDETSCSCKDRVDESQICDGNFDCPLGEDELGCYGCPQTFFSCENLNFQTGICFSVVQRCDGVQQCADGMDEKDCAVLTNSVSEYSQDFFTSQQTAGYLQKNFQGQWYPVCSPSMTWATEACLSETGPQINGFPILQEHFLQEIHPGPFLISTAMGAPGFVQNCNKAIFVQCPQIPCGTRISESIYQRPYRQNNENASTSLGEISPNIDPLFQGTTDDPIVGIVGGRKSDPQIWPFLVVLYKDGFAYCGGSIVNEYWILTAAHCFLTYTEYYFEVKAGLLRKNSLSPTQQVRRAKHVILHPDFSEETLKNDIAFILLDQPLQFNRWIRPICIPDFDINFPQPYTTCVVVGWGSMRENGRMADHLQEVELPILPNCKYELDQNDGTFCAGYPQGGKDACQGDSGGPVMCRKPNSISQWNIAGIISHGNGCARPDEPGVYTRVSKFVPWIYQIIQGPPTIEVPSLMPRNKCPGFECQSGAKECLPFQKQCDDRVDCLNAEDELNCSNQDAFKKVNTDETHSEYLQQAFVTESTQQAFVTESTQQSSTGNKFDTTELPNVHGEEMQSNGTEKLLESVTYVPPENRFTCTNLIQIILMDKRCNGFYDCEDGSDEVNCTCKEILLRKNPKAICNGHIDCYDGSDEDNCAPCGDNEYHCRRSGTCIPLIKKCDRKLDCKLNEDELDCFTLSNGEYVNLDLDERPQLNLEGVITMFQNGTWVPFCYQPRSQNYAKSQDHLGSRFCQYLGFRYLESVREFPVINGNLPERRNIIHYEYPPLYKFPNKDGNQTCSGLYIRCKPVLSSPVNTYLSMNQFSEEGTYQWPWQAGIFADGEYRCPAVLLESNWLLASSQCSQNINLKTNYTTGVFGVPSYQSPVYRPHQQVVEIDEIRSVRNSNASLFHLKNPVNRTRQVQAIFNEKRIFPSTENDTCFAVGVDKKYDSKSMFVKPVLECAKCHRCYIADPPTNCNNNTESRDWSGTVSCLGSGGWYPSAVFKNVNSICSFDKTEILDGIDYLYAHISEAMSKNLDPAEGPPCDGVRCLLGKCIPWNKVCDGIADCPDQADERPEQCQDAKQRCEHDVVGCKCSMNEMRCGNGKCIPKEKFCDGKKDCTDGTDEPQICNCAAFLAVTAKHRICDNKRDCLDKSDEDPNMCPCKDASFYCHKINRKRTCISSDMVCDNENDCPSGEDEMHCRKIQSVLRDRNGIGEVIKQSFGVWHSECFSTPVTSDMDAANICRSMGFTAGIIADETSIQHKKPVIPEHDQFYIIRLNDRTFITLRQDKPFITLVEPQETCHRLFVQCT